MELHEQRFYTGKNEYLSLIFTRWRRFHIATMLAAFFSAFCASFSFIAFDSKFSPECPLFAVVRIARYEGNAEDLSYILLKKKGNEPGTEWSDEALCKFVLYLPIIDMLAAISGLLLFCTQAGQSNLRGGFSHNSQLKLVPLTCISGFVITLFSFVAAIIVTLGGGQFCKSFEDTELESCSLAQHVRWRNNSKMNHFHDYLTKAEVSYWLMTHAWLVHSTVALIRWITNADYVIAEERELHENPIYGETALQSMAENQETLTAVALFSKNKAKD